MVRLSFAARPSSPVRPLHRRHTVRAGRPLPAVPSLRRRQPCHRPVRACPRPRSPARPPTRPSHRSGSDLEIHPSSVIVRVRHRSVVRHPSVRSVHPAVVGSSHRHAVSDRCPVASAKSPVTTVLSRTRCQRTPAPRVRSFAHNRPVTLPHIVDVNNHRVIATTVCLSTATCRFRHRCPSQPARSPTVTINSVPSTPPRQPHVVDRSVRQP